MVKERRVKCAGMTKAGVRCNHDAMDNTEFCAYHHSDDGKVRRFDDRENKTGRFAKEIPLETVDDLLNFLKSVMREVYAGELNARDASAIKQLAELYHNLLGKIKPDEQPEVRRRRMLILLEEDMPIEQAWRIMQHPEREIPLLQERASEIQVQTEVDQQIIEITGEGIQEVIDAQ